MSKSPYLPVPVSAARTIAEMYGKAIVIIFCHEPAFGLMQTTTYGVDPQNKSWAAQGGEIGAKALGGLRELSTDYEDFRLARAQALLDALREIAARSAGDVRGIAAAAIAEAEQWI